MGERTPPAAGADRGPGARRRWTTSSGRRPAGPPRWHRPGLPARRRPRRRGPLGGRVDRLEGPARPRRPRARPSMSRRSSPAACHGSRRSRGRPPCRRSRRSASLGHLRQREVDVERVGQLRGRRPGPCGPASAPARMAPTRPLSSSVGEGRHRGPEHERRGTPDEGVAGLDHLGQLGQLDAGRLRQLLALVGGQPRTVGDEVAGQLGGQPAPNGPWPPSAS